MLAMALKELGSKMLRGAGAGVRVGERAGRGTRERDQLGQGLRRHIVLTTSTLAATKICEIGAKSLIGS